MSDDKEKLTTSSQDESEGKRRAIVEQIRQEYQSIRQIDDPNTRSQRLKDFLERYKSQAKEIIKELERLEKEEIEKKDDGGDKEKGKIKETKKEKTNQLLAMAQFFNNEIRDEYLSDKPKTGIIVSGLSKLVEKKEMSLDQAELVLSKFSDYLTGEREFVILPESDFEKRLILVKLQSEEAGKKFFRIIFNNAEQFQVDSRVLEVLSLNVFGESLMTDDAKKRKERLDKYYRIRVSIKEKLESFRDRSKKLETDDLEALSKAFRFFYFDKTVSFSEIEGILNKAGISQDEVVELVKLREELIPHLGPRDIALFLSDEYYKQSLDSAIVEFDLPNFVKKYVTYDSNGKPTLTKENKLKFSKEIVKYFYLALRKVHQNHSSLFGQAKSQGGNQIDNYFGGLQGLISLLSDRLEREVFVGNTEVIDFLRDRSGRFTASIQIYAEIFHDLPLYARDAASFEKWPEFLGRLFPSEMAEAFYGDPIMEVTRSVITSYIRKRIVMNGNKIPADLFSREYNENEVRYSFQDGENIRKIVFLNLDYLKRKGIISNFEEWEVERALNYATGIGLASLIDPELITTANPNIDDFRGIYPLASKLSAKHNWGLGRGYPGANLVPELMVMDVTMFPEEKGIWRFFKKRKWVPEKIREFVSKKLTYYGEKVWDELIDRDGDYQELLSLINIFPALTSRGGWRFTPLKDELCQITGFNWDGRSSWSQEQWDKFFNEATKRYGATALWWWGGELSGARFKNFLKSYFNVRSLHAPVIEDFKNGRTAITIDINGEKKKVTYVMLQNMIDFKTRGELFYKYLLRNPGDSMMIYMQLMPELLEVDGDLSFDDEEGFFVSREKFEEKMKIKLKSVKDKRDINLKKEEWELKYEKLLRRWGGEKNFERMATLRKFIFSNLDTAVKDHLRKLGKTDDQINSEISSMTKKDKIKIFLEYFQEESNFVFNNLKLMNKDKGVGEGDIFLNENYVDNPVLRQILFGDGKNEGLFNILKPTDYAGPGTRDLFYFIAQSWWYKQGLINPFNTDMDHYRVFKKLGKVGENIMERMLSDANSVSKMIEEVAKLDRLLREIALHGESIDPKEFDKIHQTVYSTLKGCIGEDYAYRANYILAQVITKFYWEHSITRNTFVNLFGFRIPATLFLGKKISLSKLVTGNWKAHTLDSNGVRAYFRRLANDLEVLPHEGPYSFSQLEKAFDASSDVYFATEWAPNAIQFIVLFLIFTYFRKAIEETEKKK